MNAYLIYVTASDEAEARLIARFVIDERLAACANVLGGMTSIYQWKGKICEDAETAMILKTSGDRKNELIARIRELHSYETPCIVCLPITDGNSDFLHWIETETR